MSTSRRCDARCHHAKREKCDCWCGGLFHGAKGAAAREAFAEVWGEEVPPVEPSTTEPLFNGGERWAKAIAKAKEVRS